MKESSIWEKFFSVKISPMKTHKIVSICGLKLKFRCDGNRKALEKLRATIRENSVLIVETNTCHYEVIPGYAKYFSELGYNVDVAVYDGGQLDFLCEAVPTVMVFTLGEKDMDKLLGAAPIRAYHYILFSSAIKYVDGVEVNSPKMPLVTSYYHNIAADQKKMIFVQHHMERQGINRNQIALADLHNRYSDNFYMVNPHYFGNVKITPKNDGVTDFIVVGGISPRRKNYELLLSTVRRLAASGKKFKVTLVGSGDNLVFDEEIAPYFDMRGRLSYKEMFTAMEEADFFLCLLDPENPAHERYISTGTSGSFQLIYGFAKPCLIQKKFADAYAFDNGNSLVYGTNGELAETMLKAVDMPAVEYGEIQARLMLKAEDIRRRSLENLKKVLRSIDGDI